MLCYRNLAPGDKPLIEKLVGEVLAALPSPRWYYYDNDVDTWLKNGPVLGCFDGARLVGLAAWAADAHRGESSLAAKLSRPRGESYDFNDVMVSPDYRRQGIARYFLQTAVAEARQSGAKAVYSTVDPDNLPSRGNFEKHGFRCVEEKISYDGRPRCYYALDLTETE